MEFLELIGYKGEYLCNIQKYIISNLYSTDNMRREIAHNLFCFMNKYNKFLMEENYREGDELTALLKHKMKYFTSYIRTVSPILLADRWEQIGCDYLQLNGYIENEILIIMREKLTDHYFLHKRERDYAENNFPVIYSFDEKLPSITEDMNFLLNLAIYNYPIRMSERGNSSFHEYFKREYEKIISEYKNRMVKQFKEFLSTVNKRMVDGPFISTKKDIFEYFNEFYDLKIPSGKYKLPIEFYEEIDLSFETVENHICCENKKNLKIIFRFLHGLKYFMHKKYSGPNSKTHFIFKNIATVLYCHIWQSFAPICEQMDAIQYYVKDRLINSFLTSAGILKLFLSFYSFGIRFYVGGENIEESLYGFIELARETFAFDGRNIYLWGAFECMKK